jgi:hypothetical protein
MGSYWLQAAVRMLPSPLPACADPAAPGGAQGRAWHQPGCRTLPNTRRTSLSQEWRLFGHCAGSGRRQVRSQTSLSSGSMPEVNSGAGRCQLERSWDSPVRTRAPVEIHTQCAQMGWRSWQMWTSGGRCSVASCFWSVQSRWRRWALVPRWPAERRPCCRGARPAEAASPPTYLWLCTRCSILRASWLPSAASGCPRRDEVPPAGVSAAGLAARCSRHACSSQAGRELSSGIRTAAHAVVVQPARSWRREGLRAAVSQAVKGAPAAAAVPAAAAGALRTALLGVRNEMDPERFEERSQNS